MEEKKYSWDTNQQTHIKEKSNFLKHLFFCWQLPLFIKCWKKRFNIENLYAPLKEHEAKTLGDKLEQLWILEKSLSKTPSLWRVLVKQFALEFLIQGVIYLPVNIVVLVVKPIMLEKILNYFSNAEVTLEEAYVSATIITLLIFLHVVFFNFLQIQMTAFGMKIRVACSSLIYRQVLKLKPAELQRITPGKIINLLSNDVARFDRGFTLAQFLWIGPLQLAVGIVYTDFSLGHWALSGVAVLLIFLLLQICFLRTVSKWRHRVAQKTDSRLRLITDVISGIQVIKMHTWEEPFVELVKKERNSELAVIKSANLLRFTLPSSQMYLHSMCLLVTVVIFTALGLSVNPQYMYSMSSIYQDLLLSAVMLLPSAIILIVDVNVSVKRIQDFLTNESYQKSAFFNETDVGIRINNVTVNCDILKGVTFSASPGELVGITGSAGSGKTTFLHVILKDAELVTGAVTIGGTLAYAPQDPWIFSGTIRRNIVFGEDFDSSKYDQVTKMCALDKDLSLFPDHDQTSVGERGVMLSGGQKARINLARAVYRNADVYLLDDPLSAVDSHVAKHIFDECILKYLKDKCVVLVTHQVHYLVDAGVKIYTVADGTLHDWVPSVAKKSATADNSSLTVSITEKTEPVKVQKPSVVTSKRHEAYKRYLQASGHLGLCLVIFSIFILTQVLKNGTEYVLSLWVNAGTTQDPNQKLLYVSIGCFVCSVLSTQGCLTLFIKFCIRSSKSLHEKLFASTIQAPMLFFNEHSSGIILDRFSNDVGVVDGILAQFLYYTIPGFLLLLGTFIIISITNYWMIIFAIFLCTVVFLCTRIFQRVNPDLKWIETITRGYVSNHITGTLQGLTTIRAFGAEKTLAQEFDNHLNLHTTAFYILNAVYFAFGYWVCLLGVFYTGFLTFSFLFVPNEFNASSIGMAIVLAAALSEIFQYVVKDWCVVDTNMTSVERILEYIDLEPEADGGKIGPPEQWPHHGSITFDTVSLRYSPDKPLVLKKVTFRVSAGQKIGIVGRTGAGKTSLVSVLFRLHDFDGTITIDGLDTKLVPLKVLRSKMSIIPQEPVLFVGTLRKNLDPFGQFTDEIIWTTLNELELKNMFPQLVGGLESEILEGGSNFSVGQRQLLCLARTMLQKSKIIVLDEATANIDNDTDKIIQSVIRKKFRDCTVLIIAHRINTVIDCDKILVMESGRVMEFDSPHNLLRNSRSLFYGYVKENGSEAIDNLLKSAADT